MTGMGESSACVFALDPDLSKKAHPSLTGVVWNQKSGLSGPNRQSQSLDGRQVLHTWQDWPESAF